MVENSLKRIYNRSLICFQDTVNRLKYGRSAPVYAERIWVDPSACKSLLYASEIINVDKHHYTGRVITGDWPYDKVRPLLNHPKIRYCVQRWDEGKSWQDAGAYTYMNKLRIERGGEFDGCSSMEDIVRRYDQLDTVFEKVKKDGRLRTRDEINPGNFRESNGLLVHIGPKGELYFGGTSFHRFAMALVLKLPVIPAQIGCVHKEAISQLDRYRNQGGPEPANRL